MVLLGCSGCAQIEAGFTQKQEDVYVGNQASMNREKRHKAKNHTDNNEKGFHLLEPFVQKPWAQTYRSD